MVFQRCRRRRKSWLFHGPNLEVFDTNPFDSVSVRNPLNPPSGVDPRRGSLRWKTVRFAEGNRFCLSAEWLVGNLARLAWPWRRRRFYSVHSPAETAPKPLTQSIQSIQSIQSSWAAFGFGGDFRLGAICVDPRRPQYSHPPPQCLASSFSFLSRDQRRKSVRLLICTLSPWVLR